MGAPSRELTVVIPCRNEEATITRFETELFEPLDSLRISYEVIAVDDGSTDATATELERLASRRPTLRVLRHERNLGLGAALRTALPEARGEALAFVDADLTFHPRHLGRMLEVYRASKADCVSGSPFLEKTSQVPWSRRLPSILLNAFYRGLLDRRLTSYTPMFRLYRTEALRALSLECSGFEISVEILAKLLRSGARVSEIPVPLTSRLAGSSKLRRLRELANHARLTLRLFLKI